MSGSIKISQLPAATTPLAGTEAVALVQGGATKQASVTDVTTVIATGSTTARSLAARAADIVNVKDFGAVGDGVTDDTAAFNAAIASVSSGDQINVPDGNYVIAGALSYGGKFIVWECGGATVNGSVPSLSLTGAVSYITGKTVRVEQRSGAAATDIALLYNYRNANYTGGTGGAGGFVNAGFRQDIDVQSTASANEWGILSVLQNYSLTSEAVAIYGQGNKMSGGGLTWAGVFEARDNVTLGNPTTGLVGIEVDIFANGGDVNNQRVGVDVVAGKGLPAGSTCRAAFGVRIGPTNGDATSGGFDTGVYIYGDTTRGIDVRGTCVVGIDFSNGALSGPAVRLATGQKISFDATDTYALKLNSGVLQYTKNSTVLLGVSDSDNSLNISGPFKILGAQVLTYRRTGWTSPTGTASRAGYATSTATTTQIAETLKALIDDLATHGLIGS